MKANPVGVKKTLAVAVVTAMVAAIACRSGADTGGSSEPIRRAVTPADSPQVSEPATPTPTPQGPTVESFREDYVDITERLNPRLEELNVRWETATATGSEDVAGMATIADEAYEALTEGREEILALDVPQEIKSEYDTAVTAITEYQIAWGRLADALHSEDYFAVSSAADSLNAAAPSWLAARDLLRKAIGLPPGDIPE